MTIGICAPTSYDPTIAGADYLEPTVQDFLIPSLQNGLFRETWTQRGFSALPVQSLNYLFPPEVKTIGPNVNKTLLDNYMNLVLSRAEGAGVGLIVYGSGPSRTVPVGFSMDQARIQLIGNLRRWAKIASRHAVTILLEHLNRSECNIVTSVAEAAEIVRAVDDVAVRLVADTYHMALEGEPASSIGSAAELIAHVHTAEATNRNPVGTSEDHRPYFRALKDIGYDGRISIEANWTSLVDQAPKGVRDLRDQYFSA